MSVAGDQCKTARVCPVALSCLAAYMFLHSASLVSASSSLPSFFLAFLRLRFSGSWFVDFTFLPSFVLLILSFFLRALFSILLSFFPALLFFRFFGSRFDVFPVSLPCCSSHFPSPFLRCSPAALVLSSPFYWSYVLLCDETPPWHFRS